MHLLCHYLNKMGEEAYVCTDVIKPELCTPILTDSIRTTHQSISLEPIAVYPEVIHGNPLNANCVVRYILNHTGLLGGPAAFPETDLRVFYLKEYLSTGFDAEHSLLMTVPVFDFSVFNNIDNEFDDKRSGVVVYPGRCKDAEKYRPELFKDTTVITDEWPSSPREMAGVLRRSKVLYSFVNSAIIGEAVYCGCPVVMVDSPFTRRPKDYFDKKSVKGHASIPGVTFLDNEEAIDEARRRTAELYAVRQAAEDEFTEQLEAFIEKTQSMPAVSSAFKEQWGVPEWLADRAPSAARILAIQTMLQANPDVGTLGVAVIVPDGTDPHALADTLDSLVAQHRCADGIWLIGPQIPPEATGGIVEAVTGDDPWPALLSRRVEQGGMPDFLWILHAGDRLTPHATLTMGEYRLRNPDPLIWYVDDVVFDGVKPSNVFLKPDLNIDLLRSYPYIGRNLVVSTATIQAVGGLDDRVADLTLVDLIWRLVEQTGPGVVGHVPEALQSSKNSLMDWVCNAETMTWFPAVTQAHFERMGLDAQVLPGPMLGLGRVEYPLTTRPLISIIVPTRDRQPILRTCIEGLMERTSYLDYELLIVDNGSVEQDAVDFLAGLERMKMDQVRVLRWPQAFNFATINNFAVKYARGDVLLFLNNDIQFSPQTRSDWLERLLAHALRPEVGAVGTRLDLPGGRGVDQAGQVLGMDNSVGTAFQGLPVSAHGYMRRLLVQQNVSSLSASCMMMRRQVFEELGGFDEEAFPVYYADADLCMKATQAGYLLVLEPETGLLHIGGATRLLTKQFGLEARADDIQRDRLYARWLPQLARDPHYHPALGKVSPGFDLRPDASRIFEPLPGRPLPVVMAAHWDWYGCGYYRVLHPFTALEKELRLEGGLAHKGFHFTDVARVQPDVIVLQGSWLIEGILARIQRYREITGAKVVLEFDDYLPNIPTRSIHRKEMQGVIKKMRRAIEQVDWLVVSTPPLAQEYSDYHDDIRVACNGLSPDWWRGLSGRRRAGKKMRVGWAGASSHAGDLAEIRYVVKELQDEVEWVFMGMKPEGIQCEFHRGTSIVQYPAALASLNLDLAIVPLELNQFNRSKSNLRLLELGACGFPIIATDIEPFRGSLPVELVRNNRHQDWVAAIRAHLADPEALARQGDALRVAIHQNYMLEGSFLDQWAKAWGVAPAAS